MNFFEHQDQARKNTRKLIFLFALSLLFITGTVYLAAVVTLSGSLKGSKPRSSRNAINCTQPRPAASEPGVTPNMSDPAQRFKPRDSNRVAVSSSPVLVPCPPVTQKAAFSWWQPSLFFTIGTGTVVLVGLGSLYKIQTLKAGGSIIAQEMGGRLLLSEMAHPEERQLLNVVEEMAIAAGISVPAVYVMDNEQGINAFAAGFTPNDAVIGVTRGTLEQLSRDELQGVIGHEFSHILNGDMRLNIRLIGILHGLLLLYITGRVVIDWRPRGKEGNAVLAFGIALVVIGSFGLLCGRLIKSAISRQREFLADASAVQFTRNPAGIAGALDKIANHHYSSLVHAPSAESNSHLFFGSALRFNFLEELFATHPPLGQRIRRLNASKRQYAGQAPMSSSSPAVGEESLTMGFAGGSPVTRSPHIQANPAQIVSQIGTVTPEHYAYAKALLGQLPESLLLGIREPQGAIAIVYGLLLDTQNLQVRTQQLEWLKQVEPADVIEKTLTLSADIDALDPRSRLPLVDLTVPVLRQSDTDQHQRLFKCIQGLANADGRWSLPEFVLYAVLRHRLQPSSATSTQATEFTTIGQIWSDCLILLSGLAQVGQTGTDAIAYAFRSGVYRLPGAGQETLPDAPPACNMKTLKHSLDRLNLATPKLKQAIVDACAHTVLLDNKVTVQETELLRAIVILLDCPMPPFLNTGSKMFARNV
ncbi:MAG: M48 family metallopeptidase [Tildeniella nuda ZEHNDER 1965/U140]|jgi:Zn-dependent protease with chaperone function|nr:M48 family metallopeptidase [Tildeniella nuda ZEHNDER 1965/U140]